MAKSLLSRVKPAVAEFAKRFYVGLDDCSPLSMRECVTANLNTSVASEFMSKNSFSLNNYLRLRGKGYKARGTITGDI